jgi:hypothetical protein
MMNITQLKVLGDSSPQVDEKLKLLNKPTKEVGIVLMWTQQIGLKKCLFNEDGL